MASQLIIARQPDELAFFPQGATEKSHSITGGNFVSSPDGSLLVVITPTAVEVYDAAGRNKLLSVPEPGVILVALSPRNTYLVTCTKPIKDAKGQPGPNLKVWSLPSGQAVQAVPQKQVSKDHWPAIHWSGDESAFAHCVTNTVHLYSQEDAYTTFRKLTIKGVTGLAMSPVGTKLAAFVPEAKGSPACAGVYDWSGSDHGEPQALVRKSFFRTSGAQMMWNKTGSAVLVLAFTDFDVTNQSYYGEQKLHFLPSEASKSDKTATVDLKEGPVHDVQWSPSGEHFAVVAGFIPSRVMMYDANCKAVYDFGSGPYNVIRWNPFGRFLIVAGFGNLPGDILFYDKKGSGSCKQMGAVRCPAVTAEWSPDGRHLLTAITAPRLRVDNAYKLFTYYGKQVSTLPFPCLYEAAWVPAPPGAHEDRPQSPERLAASTSGGGGGSSAAAVQAPRGAGYVPPHQRGGVTGGGPAFAVGGAPRPQFSLAFDANDRPGRVAGNARPDSGKPYTPGAEFVTKAASKNAKKRANKKKTEDGKDVEEDDDAAAPAAAATAEAAQQQPKQVVQQQVRQAEAAVENLALQEGAQDGAAGADDPAKRIRALQKKLRQVTDLKEKLQKERTAITPEQRAKLDGESGLLAELKELGAAQ